MMSSGILYLLHMFCSYELYPIARIEKRIDQIATYYIVDMQKAMRFQVV